MLIQKPVITIAPTRTRPRPRIHQRSRLKYSAPEFSPDLHLVARLRGDASVALKLGTSSLSSCTPKTSAESAGTPNAIGMSGGPYDQGSIAPRQMPVEGGLLPREGGLLPREHSFARPSHLSLTGGAHHHGCGPAALGRHRSTSCRPPHRHHGHLAESHGEQHMCRSGLEGHTRPTGGGPSGCRPVGGGLAQEVSKRDVLPGGDDPDDSHSGGVEGSPHPSEREEGQMLLPILGPEAAGELMNSRPCPRGRDEHCAIGSQDLSRSRERRGRRSHMLNEIEHGDHVPP